ncbi:MAG: adenine deaminase [Desulfurococcaceae archaeon]|nr:adenine deaminase [Sulfolobales archaeon]MDW8170721.1 adenine deaminase [Desulfurococcaceae archaeon]
MFSLLEAPRNLIKAALGELKASLVIRNVNVVSTTTGEVIEGCSIIIYDEYIARVDRVRDLDRYIGVDTLVIDGGDSYALPGFIDAHVHVESSMLNVREFGRLAAIHGVTSIVADPHEVGNVLGIDGIKLMIDEAKHTPVRFFFEVPSCVPAVDPSLELDGGGASIDSGQVAFLMQDPGVVGLGEVMDFLSVINARTEALVKIASARIHGKVIDGHAPMLRGRELDAYVAAGIGSDHESTLVEEALEKLRKGMYVYIREGSAWKDLLELSKMARGTGIDLRRVALVADDISVEDLVERGYLDYIVNKAISYGVDPVKAIQMVTINPAERLRLDDKIGVLAPGRYADIVLSPSIDEVSVEKTIIGGEVVYSSGAWIHGDTGSFTYPDKALRTVKIHGDVEPGDLVIKAPRGVKALVNVIEVTPGSTLTKWVRVEMPIDSSGLLKLPQDVAYASVIDRHRGGRSIGRGFVKGLGLSRGALAQTIAHDTHNLIVAGSNPVDMYLAVRALKESGGGIVFVANGEVEALVDLPLAGLMSVKKAEVVYGELKLLEKALSSHGALFSHTYMTLSLLSLPVIPELRLTDKGYIDVVSGRVVEPIVGFEE